MKHLFLGILFLCFLGTTAQECMFDASSRSTAGCGHSSNGCTYSCGRTSPYFNDENLYMPSTTSITKKIRVNIIILQKNDGTGSFQQNIQEHMDYIDSLVFYANHQYQHLYTGQPGCTPTISDAKIEFVIGQKIFKKDTYLWNNQNDFCSYGCPGIDAGDWYLAPLGQQIHNDPNILPAINIFMTENECLYNYNALGGQTCPSSDQNNWEVDCASLASCGLIDASFIHFRNEFTKYIKVKNSTPAIDWKSTRLGMMWGQSIQLAHELGHCLGLLHQGDLTCGNLMTDVRTARKDILYDSQLKTIHANLSTKNIRNFVIEYVRNSTPISFNSNYTWDLNGQIYSDLIVLSGGNLTQNCKVLMPKDGVFSVQSGGNLNLSNGIISSSSRNKAMYNWGSFEVMLGATATIDGDSEIVIGTW